MSRPRTRTGAARSLDEHSEGRSGTRRGVPVTSVTFLHGPGTECCMTMKTSRLGRPSPRRLRSPPCGPGWAPRRVPWRVPSVVSHVPQFSLSAASASGCTIEEGAFCSEAICVSSSLRPSSMRHPLDYVTVLQIISRRFSYVGGWEYLLASLRAGRGTRPGHPPSWPCSPQRHRHPLVKGTRPWCSSGDTALSAAGPVPPNASRLLPPSSRGGGGAAVTTAVSAPRELRARREESPHPGHGLVPEAAPPNGASRGGGRLSAQSTGPESHAPVSALRPPFPPASKTPSLSPLLQFSLPPSSPLCLCPPLL